jgi:hypothetical protein
VCNACGGSGHSGKHYEWKRNFNTMY